jgi:hypothetical protein
MVNKKFMTRKIELIQKELIDLEKQESENRKTFIG